MALVVSGTSSLRKKRIFRKVKEGFLYANVSDSMVKVTKVFGGMWCLLLIVANALLVGAVEDPNSELLASYMCKLRNVKGHSKLISWFEHEEALKHCMRRLKRSRFCTLFC